MKPIVLAVALLFSAGALQAYAEPTGSALPGLGAYDEFMLALIKKWDVPGAGLAVAHKDKLLLVRGYGLASKERAVPVEPTSLFRLASLSKTITAVTVLQLVQEGRLKLDDKVLPLLGEIGPRADRIADSRVHDITVRHLLQHSGGFDRDRSGDAVFLPGAAAAARRQGGSLPPDCPTVLRDTLERKLDFAPGEVFAYSNVGYCILGRVVERVTGAPYETHVREHVLAPAGATRMRIGRTLQPAEAEVAYYDYREAKEVRAMPGLGVKLAPQPYGAFAVETMDSYGGWIGAPIDYLRFILAIDGRRGAALLKTATLTEMNVDGSSYDVGAAASFKFISASGQAGGVVCGACEASAFPFDEEAHGWMTQALGHPLAEVGDAPRRALRQVERAIAETVEHHAHLRLRSAWSR